VLVINANCCIVAGFVAVFVTVRMIGVSRECMQAEPWRQAGVPSPAVVLSALLILWLDFHLKKILWLDVST
jgi:hypothetical protein